MMVVVAGVAMPCGKAWATGCKTDADGYCTEKVVRMQLSTSEKDPVIKINTALGLGTTIELPVGVKLAGKPVLSNDQLFRVPESDDWSKVRIIEVSPKRPDKAPADIDLRRLLGQMVGRVRVPFAGGVTLLIGLRAVDARSEHGVERLVLEFPEFAEFASAIEEMRAEAQREIDKQRDAWTKTRDEEAQREGFRWLFRQWLERFECRDIGIVGENGLAMVEASEICHIGNRMAVRFEILNRSKRSNFAVDTVTVTAAGQPVKSEYVLEGGLSTSRLKFDEAIKGFIWWPRSDHTEFELVITERAGIGRKVRVPEISF
jgi:hypothetical protein